MSEDYLTNTVEGEEIDRECPDCGETLKSAVFDGSSEKAGCPECDYEDSNPPKYDGLTGVVRWHLSKALHPYSRTIAVVVFPLLWASFVVASVYTEMSNISTILLVGGTPWIFAGLLPFLEPIEYCGECNTEIDPDQRFCENCGASVQEPASNVDMDKESPHERILSRLKGEREWLEFGFATLNFRKVPQQERFDRLVEGREEIWKRVFDLGSVVAMLGTAAAIGFALKVAWGLIRWPGLLRRDIDYVSAVIDFAAGLTSTSASPGQAASFPHVEMLDLALFLGGALLFISAIVFTVIIHEIGHAIALTLHGHEVDEFGINTILGVIPNFAWTAEAFSDTGSVDWRASIHVAAGGITLTLPLFVLLIPSVLGVQFPHILDIVINGLFIGAIISLANAIPLPGSDGWYLYESTIQRVIVAANYDNVDSQTGSQVIARLGFWAVVALFIIGGVI